MTYFFLCLHYLVQAMTQIAHYDLFKTKQWLETPRKAFKRGHKQIKMSYKVYHDTEICLKTLSRKSLVH